MTLIRETYPKKMAKAASERREKLANKREEMTSKKTAAEDSLAERKMKKARKLCMKTICLSGEAAENWKKRKAEKAS